MWLPIAAFKADDARWIIVSCAFIALLVIVGGLGVWYYRKRVLFSDQVSATWTFDDLRRMRDRGDLTEEEYQSLRSAMVGSFQGKPKKESSPSTTDIPQDPNGPQAQF